MKVIKALRVIKDYCNNNLSCHDCIFGQKHFCLIQERPDDWDVKYFEGFSHRKGPQVKIKLVEGGQMPTKAHASDAAFDCYAREYVFVNNKAVLIPLGFCMELPEGYVAKVVPRSSIGLKTPLRAPHSVGIIDAGYRNEVCMEYECKQGETYEIKKGDRICQMLIEKVEPVELVEVEELADSDRGMNGWGSSGK